MEPVLALSLHAPANHTYNVPDSMLTPIEAGYVPTVKMRGQLEEKLVWYWNHSTVKSPVPTAQSALPGSETYWFVPLNEMLPPFTAEVCVTTPKTTNSAATAAIRLLGLFTGLRVPACPTPRCAIACQTPRRSATRRSLASGCTTATRTWREPPAP